MLCRPRFTAYVDTNRFIHRGDLKDLPRQERFAGAGIIERVVAPVVVDELDQLKMDREGRRRDRARVAQRLIEQASQVSPTFAVSTSV